MGKLPIKTPKRCLLILDLKPFKGQRRVFYWYRIPDTSYTRKGTPDLDILIISRNGDGKIIKANITTV